MCGRSADNAARAPFRSASVFLNGYRIWVRLTAGRLPVIRSAVAVIAGVFALAFCQIINSYAATIPEPTSVTNISVQLTEAERNWIKAHPVVRWGFDPNWPPFSRLDAYDRAVGIDADLTRLVARRVGLQLEIVSGASWSEVYAKANAGEIDFLSATAKTPQRLAKFDFSHSYGTFPVVIITRNEAPFLTTMPDLGSLSIATPRDHVLTDELKRDMPSVRFILTDKAEEALKLVSHGDADATVQNLAVASRIIRLDGLTNLKISGMTRYENPLRFAVRKEMPELLSILNKGLATITPSEKEAIYAAYLTPDIGKARDWAMWRRTAWRVAEFCACLTAVLLLWNCILKREVRRRKTAQKALEEARDRLEARTRELDQRVKQIERLNEELRAANHDLESFSVSTSHDLRGPLRRMSSFAELLQKEAGPFLSRRHSEWLALVVKESRFMDHVIHDMLELARLGRRELRMQRLNMAQLVKSVVEDIQSQARTRRIVWNVGALGDVCGDPTLLRLAVANLIDNALKYTRHVPVAEITIDVDREASDAVEATLFIRDNGCGFEMKEAAKIFEPFERLPQSVEFEGIGIGLANVNKIIQKHGGKIWCESAPDQGARFYFTLPVPDELKHEPGLQMAGRHS